MKKTISFLLAVLFVMTAFGATTVFGGLLGAGAEFYDYINYTQIPGFSAFSADGLTDAMANNFMVEFSGFTSEGLPAVEGFTEAANFTVEKRDQWGGASVHTFKKRTFLDEESSNWAANDAIEGTNIFGDSGVSFAESSGVTLYVALNGAPYAGSVSLTLFNIPQQGPYYSSSEDTHSQDMIDKPVGFVYGGSAKQVDADGYVYFDFKTDFHQSDWWSRDDNGDNWYEMGQCPVPKSKLAQLTGYNIRLANVQVGDVITIGDMRVCVDTRIHTDALDEVISVFDSLDPEAYTEESYAAASEVYLKAFEVFLEPESQKEVDEAESELRMAIAALKPMFHVKEELVDIVGFEGWTEEDLDNISMAGLDTPVIDTENVPAGSEQSIMIMANATSGEPTWGWSWFNSGLKEDDSVTAIGNPFALEEGSEPLSSASGLRFWVKWDTSLDPIPTSMRVGVGSSSSNVFFECEEYSITLPETEGYIGLPWSIFFDLEGEADIYEYIDELDYMSIMIDGAVGIYYVADLHAFKWDIATADYEPLQRTINEAYAYMETLDPNLYYYVSWDRVMASIASAEAIIGAYGITQEDADAAQNLITSTINKLVLIKDMAKRETMNKLKALHAAGSSYWRGNVTPASYRALMLAVSEAGTLIDEGPSEENAQKAIAALDAAIDALVPIKAGEKVTSIHSFESYNNRELNRANGDRTEGVDYSLAKAANVPNMPEGYAQALKMVALQDLYADNTDEHGVMQFKAMSRDTGKVMPLLLGPNEENLLMGDLTGTDGICLWIGINDVNLVQDCSFRFAVSNCQVGPLFERAAHDIPLPSTGHGWLYIPWEYFEFYDDWTHGEPINLAKIYFYILRFNGSVKQGLEVYVTGIHAYKNTTDGEWVDPVIPNITDGATIDLAETTLVPNWNAGTATLDGENFIFGNKVTTNGEHTLEVRNGNKKASVSFTIVNGEDKEYETPVIGGVEEGGEYVSAVPSWNIGTATLNGNPFEMGGEITELGDYTLVVTNGNKQVTVNFKIVEAKPEGIRGDLDADGKITVSDALAALRVAAKMAEETADIVALGDADNDGKITVSDALAILRVAAKMADSI